MDVDCFDVHEEFLVHWPKERERVVCSMGAGTIVVRGVTVPPSAQRALVLLATIAVRWGTSFQNARSGTQK